MLTLPQGIPEAIVDEIRQRTDLISLVGEYLTLEKRGKNMVGLCPFHSEKTPSFTISPEKQLFHCFGCSASGNVFSFIMKMDNLTFTEAARSLAKRTGIKIPELSTPPGKKDVLREQIYKLNRLAAHFFAYCLKEAPAGKDALKYLQERGIYHDVSEVFMLGYAPRGWDNFTRYACGKGYSPELLLQAGLVSARDGGGVYDRFRHRITFPIFHVNGKVVGFGGRTLDEGEKAGPKYLNSPETPVFQKGAVLYGLHLARDQMRLDNLAVVVEGYTDVIAAHQAGLKNVVASQGTALTSVQGRLLRSQAETVVIAYDADSAGEAATWRGLKILRDAGCMVRVAELPAGSDPDSLIREKGAAQFLKLIGNAAPLVEYQLSKIKERSKTAPDEGRLRYMAEALALLQQVANLVERDFYLKKVAEEIGVSEEALRGELKKSGKKGNHVNNLVVKDQTNNINQIRVSAAEKLLLSLIIQQKETVALTREELTAEDFEHPVVRQIMEEIWKIEGTGAALSGEGLIDHFSDPQAHMLIAAASTDPSLQNLPWETMERMAGDCVAKIKENKLERRRREVHEKLKAMEKQGLDEQARNLLREQLQMIVKTCRSPYRSGGGENFNG